MKRFAIVALKGVGWLGLALVLLFLSWAAFNNKWVDAAPRPVPERLQARAAPVAAGKNAFPVMVGLKSTAWDDAEPLRCNADKSVCAELWIAQREALSVQLEKHRESGEQCAALTQAGMGFEEPWPDFSVSFMALNNAIPPFQNFTRCARWLQAQAVVLAERKQFDALARLEQSDRLVRMQLTGSNSLISHVVGWSNARLQWQTVAVLGARHPAWTQLDALLRPLPDAALSPDRWIAYEAAYGRAASAGIVEGCNDPVLRKQRQESKLELWATCEAGLGFMLNATVQLGDDMWLRALDQSEANAKATPLAPRFAMPASEGGWRWRNTLGHILYQVAETAWNGYPEKQADVELQRQAAVLALQLSRIPAAERAAWLQAHPVDAALRERIRLDGGQVVARSWQAQTETPEFRLPLAPS